MADDYIWIVTDPTPAGSRDGAVTRNPYADDTPRTATVNRSDIPVSAAKLEPTFRTFNWHSEN